MGIEAAIAAAIVSAGASAAAAAFIASVIVNTVISVALGALSSALSPKPKTPNLDGFANKASGITQNIKQAISTRRKLYGEARVGGALTTIETTNNDEKIHLILAIADHECEEIGEIWFNDVSIPPDFIDGNGDVISGEFAGFARIKKHLGGAGQVADADLVSETSATSNHIGDSMTYLYVTLTYDRDIYPTSVPVITAFVKGQKILDPRDSVTRWTANGVLFIRDHLITPLDAFVPGAGADATDIDDTYLTSSANTADEMVTTEALVQTSVDNVHATDLITLNSTNDTLVYQTGDRVQLTTTGALPTGLALATNYFVIPYQRKTTLRIKLASTLANAMAGTAIDFTSTGSGTMTITKNAEPRYYGGGIVQSSESIGEVLKDLLTTIGGDFTYVGGVWKIKAASFHTPVFTFDETHLRSEISVQTKTSRRDRFNLIKGIYVSPLNEGEPADYPIVTNSTYVTADNGKTIPIDFDLPMTQRPQTAQRLAKIKLERHRQELFFEADFDMSATKVQPGDVVYLNNDVLGWSSKPFEVVKWVLDNARKNGVPEYFVKMSLQETASGVYDWDSATEETSVDPAPNTNLPDALTVGPPTGLAVVPVEVPTAFGDITYEFIISWTPPADVFVVNGGHYNVEFKKSSESEFRRSFRAEDSDTDIRVPQVQPGVNYDVRIQSVSQIGVRSTFQQLLGFTVSSPSGATIRLDYFNITGPVTETIDYGAITGLNDSMTDFGSLDATIKVFSIEFSDVFG